MHLMNKGRESFLEFLRNLGPQIIIIVAAILMQAKLGKFDNTYEWYKHFAAVLLLWLTWILAMTANFTHFLRKFAESCDEYDKAMKMNDIGLWKRIVFMWSVRKSFFLELILVLLIASISTIPVWISSIFSSASALNMLQINIG